MNELEQLEVQRAEIKKEIARQGKKLSHIELKILQVHSRHGDIAIGTKLMLTTACIDWLDSGQFSRKGFSIAGVTVIVFGWDCDNLTYDIRTAGRWNNRTRTAISIPLAIIDDMRISWKDAQDDG